MTKFTEAHLKALRTHWSKVKTVSTDNLHAMFDKMTDEQLAQLPGARINFVSKLAVDACIRRNVAFKF